MDEQLQKLRRKLSSWDDIQTAYTLAIAEERSDSAATSLQELIKKTILQCQFTSFAL